ncbi:MAG: hypothetical protein FWG84_06855 [Bacteroidales bacterium]|nr:hypothetical protein [Bacteroidales bacterium]
MKKFRFSLRSMALTVACLAVSMMLVSGCKKDDKKDDNGGGNGDNPFFGTWINDDDDDVILEFTASMWTIEDYGDLYCSGTYTYDGNSATLTVTAVGTRGVEKGDVGTAELSDDIMTVTLGDEIMLFSTDGGGYDPNGPGSESDPFKVATVADLKRVASGEKGPEGVAWASDRYYLQTADIDLSGEANWRTIGGEVDEHSFSGTYDGGGYTISNLTITDFENQYACIGLFGYVGGTIKNVRLNGVNITISRDGALAAGGIAGRIGPGTIDHCSVNDVNMVVNTFWGVGGIAGIVMSYPSVSWWGIVSNCMVTNGAIKGCDAGGIVSSNSGTIENCYTTVDVINMPIDMMGGANAGGIANGSSGGGIIQYCYATGNITSDGAWAGGIAGENMASTIQNCVALNKALQSDYSGGHIGRITGQNITNAYGDEGETLNNFARENMSLILAWQPYPVTDISPTSIHGADVSAADYNGANSGTWWKNTAGFPESSWDFAPNRLPHLKGFDGLTQNPTVTP